MFNVVVFSVIACAVSGWIGFIIAYIVVNKHSQQIAKLHRETMEMVRHIGVDETKNYISPKEES